MTISKLIKKLQNIQENKGDLVIYINDNNNILKDIVIGENIIDNCNSKIAILL